MLYRNRLPGWIGKYFDYKRPCSMYRILKYWPLLPLFPSTLHQSTIHPSISLRACLVAREHADGRSFSISYRKLSGFSRAFVRWHWKMGLKCAPANAQRWYHDTQTHTGRQGENHTTIVLDKNCLVIFPSWHVWLFFTYLLVGNKSDFWFVVIQRETCLRI